MLGERVGVREMQRIRGKVKETGGGKKQLRSNLAERKEMEKNIPLKTRL